MPVTQGGLEPATIINNNTGETVLCMFNPYEYAITKKNEFEKGETKGLNVPRIRFKQGGAQTLKLQLFFDTYDKKMDVRAHTEGLWRMMMVDEDRADQQTGKSQPPIVTFRWGRFEFQAVITSLTQKMTLFLKDGTPVRTTVDIDLQQIADPAAYARQNPTSGGGVAPKTRTVHAGDRLDLIAWEEYGDATRWRLIAEANDITDPLHLPSGQVLAIPPIKESLPY